MLTGLHQRPCIRHSCPADRGPGAAAAWCDVAATQQ
jgi:hypothetical protein